MSVALMAKVFHADIPHLAYEKDGEKGNVRAATAKLILLAIADHANDRGESAYPGYDRLKRFTSLSWQGLADGMAALEQNKYLTIDRKGSKIGTNDYQVNVELLESLLYQAEKEKQTILYQAEKDFSAGQRQPSLPGGDDPSDKPSGKPLVDPRWKFEFFGDYTRYPSDVWETLIEFCLLWNMSLPSFGKKSKENSRGVQWLNGARELQRACAEFGVEALRDYRKTFEQYMQGHNGVAPHTVSSPKSLVNPIAAHVGIMRGRQKEEEPVKELVYVDGRPTWR